MSRPRSTQWGWLPKGCYFNRGRIVYRAPGVKDARLCSAAEATYAVVIKRLAEHLDSQPDTSTLKWLCEQYNESAKFLKLKPATRKAYGYHFNTIVNFEGKGGMLMGEAGFADITTGLLQRYLDKRAVQGDPVAGNREVKGYLSAVYAWALRREYLQKGAANPCLGVERNKEVKDTRYVEHWEFNYAAERASPYYVVLWMWLAYLLAARTTEVLQLRKDDLLKEGVRVRRLKGSKTNVVKWSKQLAWIVEQCLGLQGQVSSIYLLHDNNGQPITYSALRNAWDDLMAKCGKAAVQDSLVWVPFRRHHLKSKGSSDHETGRITGHRDEGMHNYYRRLVELVNPVM